MGLFSKSFNHKILTPQERRIKTFEKLKKQKIAVNEYLPLLPPGESVKLKSMDLTSDREFADASNICNTVRAVSIAGMINNIAAGLRNIEKILDMTDLFYCYHWACEEKRIRPETSTGKLNSEVVAERRRGLEWLVSDEKDWNQISLDT